jgi:hypothetical protein
MGLRWALLFTLTVGLALPAAAQTDPAPTSAATRQKEMAARKAFASSDWDRALDLFSDLYAQTLHPVYLRNIGRCHQKMRQPQKAIDAFQDYLAKNKHLGPGERQEIDGYIAEMERLRDEQARAPRPEATPAPGPPPVNEPLPPVPNAAPPPDTRAVVAAPLPPDEPLYKKWWLWTAVGAVVAGAVVAAVAVSHGGSMTKVCPPGVVSCQ